MAAISDVSVGYKKETTYNTGVTVDRWLPFLDESLDYAREVKQGAGLEVGTGGTMLASRRFSPTMGGSGDLTVECVSKGMGTLLEAALGGAASTLVTGTTYQQTFTLGSDVVPMTIQKGLVDAGGTVHPYTFEGCVANSLEFSIPHTEAATLKVGFDVCSLDTAVNYATPTYAADPTLYHWGLASATVGGSVTYPTTTTLATGGTAVTNVRDFSLSLSHNIAADRYLMSGGGLKAQPTNGVRSISGTMTADYVDDVLRDALIADTALPIVITMTSEEALSDGYATLQVVLPHCRLDGELPKSNRGNQISTQFKFTVLDDGTNEALWFLLRTADTAL